MQIKVGNSACGANSPQPCGRPVRGRSFGIYQKEPSRSPEELRKATVTCTTRLVEKPRLLNTTSSAVLRLPFPPRNKSRMERGPTASSVNTFGCFSLRSTLTVIGSGTFKHKKHEAFTGPAAKGSVPFTGKALERTRPESCEWVLEPRPPAADGPQRTWAGGERASWYSAGLGRRQARRGWAGIPNCTYAPYTC